MSHPLSHNGSIKEAGVFDTFNSHLEFAWLKVFYSTLYQCKKLISRQYMIIKQVLEAISQRMLKNAEAQFIWSAKVSDAYFSITILTLFSNTCFSIVYANFSMLK